MMEKEEQKTVKVSFGDWANIQRLKMDFGFQRGGQVVHLAMMVAGGRMESVAQRIVKARRMGWIR